MAPLSQNDPPCWRVLQDDLPGCLNDLPGCLRGRLVQRAALADAASRKLVVLRRASSSSVTCHPFFTFFLRYLLTLSRTLAIASSLANLPCEGGL